METRRHIGNMVLPSVSRKHILKYAVVIFTVYIVVKLLSGSGRLEETPELPVLVTQRGNKRYFTSKTGLNPESYSNSKQAFLWEKQKQIVSTDVTFGKLNVHIWGEICGTDLNSLKNHVLFPKYPAKRFYTKSTLFTHSTGNFDYGERIFGFILAKFTGYHSFQIHGKSLEMWISENSHPSSSKKVYENLHRTLPGKFEVKFEANTKYYVEILHKKSSEDEDLKLTWKVPGSSSYMQLSGSDISVKFLDEYLRNGEIDSTESSLDIAHIHRKDSFPVLNERERRRNDLFNIPLLESTVLENLLPSCEYRPSYIVDHTLTNYRGVWETHYNSLYPIDETNVTRGGWVCLGNDVLVKEDAVSIVDDFMRSLTKKSSGRYRLERILSVEKNSDPFRGDRYLLELEVEDVQTNKMYRLSEYVYKQKEQTTLCAPQGYHWRRNATVNIVLTVGGRQGRWVQHFINNLAEIYRQTKDANLNVIIIDFHSKDINIEESLKQSGLPHYVLLYMKSKFHKTIGLQYAMKIVTDPNDIVFVCDLHLYLPVTIVDHIRKHCIQGKTAFNPLLIRLDCGFTANNPGGRWEHDGFGPIATFKSDWDRFGGMNVEKFKHSWGGEDWDMVDRILSAGLEIERLKILNFFHFYHTKKGMWKESEQ